jgi:ABC-type molybdenum transport system ATPase subunit/photorepair protein PhrA
MLTITAQQSRFHNEAIEGSALKEVNMRQASLQTTVNADLIKLVVKDLSISIGQREILSHAQFQLQVGKHYVLVGRNGIGKSSKKMMRLGHISTY